MLDHTRVALATLLLLSGAGCSRRQSERLVTPEELALTMGSNVRPIILNVGPQVLYRRARIPGSRYVGMTSTPDGLAALGKEVQDLSRDATIVIYCGCCPWEKCPNVRPAMEELDTLGFTKAKALFLPHNFQIDWVAKGLPVARE